MVAVLKCRRWNQEEERLAAKMLLAGHSVAEVAECLGRTKRAVSYWLQGLRQATGWQMTDKALFREILGLVTDDEEKPCDFTPMLTVNIETGAVTLDRMEEALS